MELTERFYQALDYAARLHAGQRRKGSNSPYVSHLLRVSGIAMEFGADEDEAIAALLHDAVEDQGGARTGEIIRNRFGNRVADVVLGCSDTDTFPKPPWRERKEAHLAKLRHASRSVCLITAADKLDNVRSLLAEYRRLGESLWGDFKGGQSGTLWYSRAVVEVLREHGSHLLVEELDRAVSELERLVGAVPSAEGPTNTSITPAQE
jgi:GTP pyrophosphokinase